MAAIGLAPNTETMVGSLVQRESVIHVSILARAHPFRETHSCIHVCINSQMKGAADCDVFGALVRLPEENVPVKKVRLVFGTPVCEKSAGLYRNGEATASSVPLTSES